LTLLLLNSSTLKILGLHTIPKKTQSIISVLSVLLISLLCFSTINLVGYQVTALVLLLVVSVLAMLFDITPVLLAACLSAIIWNFFFIPPIYTFHIAKAEDAFLFLMYFVVAMVNAILTFKIRETEKKVRDKEEKENTIKLYNTLLNSLSHELKTPIATIIGAVDTLKDNPTINESNKTELITQIGIAGLRLNKEVENLLSISRLESGVLKLNYDWCDLNELVNIVINILEADLNGHIISFQQNEQMPLVKLDSLLIQHALYNLLHNAIQYTPNGTFINIHFHMDEEDCIISINDNGQGFPENEQVKVFDMFYRLPMHKTGGSGLGLSIVKGFIEAHKGTIQLISEEGNGSEFIIKLPVETSYVNKINND
jgi:two-component system, OmpR family, sensor histidine kinase KdpD